MSMYGPPGGGGQYPGQPQDPWQGGSGDPYGGQPGGPYGGQPHDPYGQPGGPYGQPSGPYGDPYGGQPHDPYGQPSGPPADPYGGHWGAPPPPPPMSGPPGQWGPPGPPQPPQKSNTGLIVGLAAVGVLVLLVGAVVVFLLLGDDNPTPTADPTTSPTAEATTDEPTDEPTTEEPTDEPTKTDLDDVAEGDCLYDSNPSDTSASLSYVSCEEHGEDHYKVLKRFDDTQDSSKCNDVSGYDTSFTSSSGNFVICTEELV